MAHNGAQFGQEGSDGYLACQPLLGVIVQERRPGHHPRHNRCGLQMHQYVAARRNPHCLVAGHAVLTGNGLCGRERRGRIISFGRFVAHSTPAIIPLEIPYEETRQIDVALEAVVLDEAGVLVALGDLAGPLVQWAVVGDGQPHGGYGVRDSGSHSAQPGQSMSIVW